MPTSTKPAVKEVVTTLNRQQANALVTYLNYTMYRWLTYGRLFRDLHLLFEEHATAVHDMIDEFAERALMIDGRPLADRAGYLPAATVKPSSGDLDVSRMVAEAIAAHD